MLSDGIGIENVMETAMVDIAYELLKNKGEPIMYQDILSQVASLKGFTEDDVQKYIAQLYTSINIDGRFTCVGRGLWGLKYWYPIDQTTESAVAANVKDDYLEDEVNMLYDEDQDSFITEASVEIDDLDDDLGDAVVKDPEVELLEEVREAESLNEALEVDDDDLDLGLELDEEDDDEDEDGEFEDEEEV